MKKFYKSVSVTSDDGMHGIELDGRPLKTKGGVPLCAVHEPLIQAIADEWRIQDETLDPATMPLMRLQTTVIDLGEAQGDAWTDRFINFAENDLICYRAKTPAELKERQSQIWDPYLTWLTTDLGVRLNTGYGFAFIHQDSNDISELRTIVNNSSLPERLALRILAEITSSAVLPLAVWKRAFSDDDVFAASLLDELFQNEQWGVDDEALQRRQLIKSEFDEAIKFLRLSSE